MTRKTQRIFVILIVIILFCAFLINTFTHMSHREEFNPGPTNKGSLPGIGAYSAELNTQIQNKLKQLGPKYQPRTQHHDASGHPKYTNRLILETNPYLFQHAHNPVNWFPWNEETFYLAKKYNRPILLSIGYSTCHWCHVMEHESFEDTEIAEFINEHYIAIKVDREERPDIDDVYMKAVQALTGRGGWPMTVWLTPDAKPFYGGTYFPARDGDRGASIGFLTLLKKLNELYRANDKEVEQTTARLTEILHEDHYQPVKDLKLKESLQRALADYAKHYDVKNGGLQGAPKFPSSLPARLLFRDYYHYHHQNSLEMGLNTLNKMALGGIYDQIGGGFHRYAVDATWTVPHFEKMLYDNALLVHHYLDAYQITGKAFYQDITKDILKFISNEMTSPEGAFYSALDADSRTPEGKMVEGYYYTWTRNEFQTLLDSNHAAAVADYYNIGKIGHFEGRNIPHITNTVQEPLVKNYLNTAKQKLYQHRETRPRPALDDKIISSWNGIAIAAFARAGFVLNESEYTQKAVRAAEFIFQHLYKNGELYRRYKDGHIGHTGYLNDYANMINACLELYQSTHEVKWFNYATQLDKTLEQQFEDHDKGGFYLTSKNAEKLLSRDKPYYDGAMPSGNAVSLMNLLRLYTFTTNHAYKQRAEKLLHYFANRFQAFPSALSEMLRGIDYYLDEPKQVVIITAKNDPNTQTIFNTYKHTYSPNSILIVATQSEDLDHLSKTLPLVHNKIAKNNKTTIYVCLDGVCELPTQHAHVLEKQLLRSSIPAQAHLIWEIYNKNTLTQAKQDQRPVLVNFTANWCEHCKTMDSTTFLDKELLAAANKVDLMGVTVDLSDFNEENKSLFKSYKGHDLPYAVLIDKNGQIQRHFSGVFGADTITRELLKLS